MSDDEPFYSVCQYCNACLIAEEQKLVWVKYVRRPLEEPFIIHQSCKKEYDLLRIEECE